MAVEQLALLFQICSHSAKEPYKLLLIYISIKKIRIISWCLDLNMKYECLLQEKHS